MRMSVANLWTRRPLACVAGLLSLVLSAPASAMADDEDSQLLTIGSKAPALNVEHWVNDGKGKFKPVTDFKSGKVYVVEFWATWCGPCVASMPHLSSLQTRFADKGVQIVSISDEDLETVEEFLDRAYDSKDPSEKDAPETFRELTSTYCLTTDPDKSSYKDYMNAAKQNGIPTSFVVGKQGLIEWIGHPMELDKVLEDVTADKWDRVAYLAEFKARQEAQANMNKVFGLVNRKKTKEAIELIDSMIEKNAGTPIGKQYKVLKLQIMLQTKGEGIVGAAKDVFAEIKEEKEMINQISWAFVQMTEADQLDNKELLQVALDAMNGAVKDAPKDSKFAMLDTVAHLLYLTDDLDKAIEVQKEAIAGADAATKASLQDFLDTLLEEKKSKK